MHMRHPDGVIEARGRVIRGLRQASGAAVSIQERRVPYGSVA
mgnify:CR=1 FL=1